MKFHAAMQGVDIEKEVENAPKTTGEVKSQPKGFLFKHPDEYKKMSAEEKESITQNMMGDLKAWAGNQKAVKAGQ